MADHTPAKAPVGLIGAIFFQVLEITPLSGRSLAGLEAPYPRFAR